MCHGHRLNCAARAPGVIESAFDAAGITAGSWYASPATHVGYELIGAAMLILA
jgi:hypothetical protein